jgi:hypothetical protein
LPEDAKILLHPLPTPTLLRESVASATNDRS